MLTTQNLSIKQGDITLWQAINLSVEQHQRLGIFAPSGYGKTTLGRVLAGWQSPHNGKILLDGQPLLQQGYCPIQLIPQHPERTFNPLRRVGATLNDIWSPDDYWFSQLAIDKRLLTRRPHELSGGELARLALLRALDPRTRYLIADEMTAQLDPLLQSTIWRSLLIEAEQRPLGMIIISHNLALLQHVCTDIWQPTHS